MVTDRDLQPCSIHVRSDCIYQCVVCSLSSSDNCVSILFYGHIQLYTMAFKSKTELGAGQTQDSDHNDQTLDADIDIAPQHIHAKTIVLLVVCMALCIVRYSCC